MTCKFCKPKKCEFCSAARKHPTICADCGAEFIMIQVGQDAEDVRNAITWALRSKEKHVKQSPKMKAAWRRIDKSILEQMRNAKHD